MSEYDDMVRKLIRLATNNPNPEEATAAAVKACELITKHSIVIGEVTSHPVGFEQPSWKPPSQEDADFVEEVLKANKTADQNQDYDPPVKVPDQDIDEDWWMKKIKTAWRAIRAERLRLASEVYRYEKETGRTFWGGGKPPWER